MDKVEKKELLNIVEKIDVDEVAYLIVTDNSIGVTDSIEEVCALSKKQQENGEIIKILKGYKCELLSIQQRILIIDEARNNINAERLTIPVKYNDYNLLPRKKKNDNNSFYELIR